MRYIHAVQGSFIACLLFIAAAIAIPIVEPPEQAELVLTVSTFLFAILAGFFISRSSSRYDQMREQVANEDALLISFYRTSIFLGKQFQNKVRTILDKYYIKVFDYKLGEHYKSTSGYISELYEELKKIKITKGHKEQMFDDVVLTLNEIEGARNKSSVVGFLKLTRGHWAILISLACIIVYNVYAMRGEAFYSDFTTVLLSTVLVLVLLIIRDLENFAIGGVAPLVESVQENLEIMGLKRYYHNDLIRRKMVRIPKEVKKYRVGYHSPGEKPDIKVITRS